MIEPPIKELTEMPATELELLQRTGSVNSDTRSHRFLDIVGCEVVESLAAQGFHGKTEVRQTDQ